MKLIFICFSLLCLVACKKKSEHIPCQNFTDPDGKIIILNECASICTNFDHDPENCGLCGNSCSKQGKVSCINGKCSDNCQNVEEVVCNNKCVVITVDSENCGACGVVCGQNKYCVDGKCEKSEQ